jgi:beta-galactosidase
MHGSLDCDPADMARDLSLTSWDSYPVTGSEKDGDDQTYRIADPSAIGLTHDQMASYHKRWALMELQPGQVNWSGVPVLPYPGTIRLWIWTAFAHGAEFVTTYRYRQPRFGIELFHDGLVGTDGVTPTSGGKQFAQVISEMRKLDLQNVPKFADEPIDAKRTAGLVFDFEQLWWAATLPQSRRWNQLRWMISWYSALSRLGLRILILRPGTAWPKDLPIVVAPAVQMIDDATIEQMRSYSASGGNLVLTCRTGLMDRTGQLFEGRWGKPILPMIGASIDSYDSLRDDRFGKIRFGEKDYAWGVWGDQLTAEPGTEVLATYADQFYAGSAAITYRKTASGSVSYFGVFSEQPLVDSFVAKLAERIGRDGIAAEVLPNRVQILRRGPYRIALNYQDQPVEICVPKNAKFLIGSSRLGPADVAVWAQE